MDIQLQKNKDSYKKGQLNWHILTVEDRIDAFNFLDFKTKIEKLIASGEHRIALDFTHTRFLSLTSIQFLTQVADQLQFLKGGLAIFGIVEKLKRQISIYASREKMHIVNQKEQL